MTTTTAEERKVKKNKQKINIKTNEQRFMMRIPCAADQLASSKRDNNKNVCSRTTIVSGDDGGGGTGTGDDDDDDDENNNNNNRSRCNGETFEYDVSAGIEPKIQREPNSQYYSGLDVDRSKQNSTD